MRGLILAAGRGSRLGDYNDGTPKCLLEVGRRRLIEHQLEALAECGVAPVAMVVGYGADEVRDAVGIRAEYVHNRRWEQTNSIYSFWLAREWLSDAVVVLNCDVLFSPEILARLLEVEGDAIAYDSTSGGSPEHMKVTVRDGRLCDMSKNMPASESAGENVGVLCFTAETARAIAERADALIAAGHEKTWLGAAVREVAQERHINAVDIAGLPWGEVDSAYDLEHVRKNVWPRMRRDSTPPRRVARVAAAPLLAFGLLSLLGYTWLTGHKEAGDWDTLDVQGVVQTDLALDDRTQGWWLLEAGGSAEALVHGPGPIRVESRLLLDTKTDERVPYVIAVELDGKLVDIFKHSGAPDPAAHVGSSTAAQRKRIEIDVPSGAHTVRVRLLASDASSRCLIRVREPDLDPEPEPDP